MKCSWRVRGYAGGLTPTSYYVILLLNGSLWRNQIQVDPNTYDFLLFTFSYPFSLIFFSFLDTTTNIKNYLKQWQEFIAEMHFL